MGRRRLPLFAFVLLGLPALSACPTVDLGDTPEDVGLCNPMQGEPYFETMIWPTYLNGAGSAQCTQGGCHDQGGQSALRFKTNPIDLPANYKASLIYLNCATPEASRMLTKPLAGTEGHFGGDIFPDLNDPAVQVFLDWFNP